MTTPGLGHNRGPGLGTESGHGWRVHCWTEARRALLPTLPLEIIRFRVRRAAEIGLDYRTYATVRATAGNDIIAFLFSTNALRLLRTADRLPPDREARLRAIRDCARTVLAQPPLDPGRVAATLTEAAVPVAGAATAPRFAAPWSEVRACVQAALAPAMLPAGGVLLVGDTTAEREWAEAGRLAGYLPAERYFPTGPAA